MTRVERGSRAPDRRVPVRRCRGRPRSDERGLVFDRPADQHDRVEPLAQIAALLATDPFPVVRLDAKRLEVATPEGPLVVQHDGPIFIVTRASAATKVTRICEDVSQVVATVRSWRSGTSKTR